MAKSKNGNDKPERKKRKKKKKIIDANNMPFIAVTSLLGLSILIPVILLQTGMLGIGTGIILSGFCLVMGFALVWHIWWLVALSFAATIVGAIYHTFNYKRDFDIPAATVTAVEEARTRQLAAGA